MALYYDLPVYRDTYKLILKIFECTKDFSKEFKYTLGQDMKRDALQLVRSIYRSNKAQQKAVHLETFMDDFELLKLEIRLCVDMKILPIKKQAELSLLMDSIGKQITGWRNSSGI
jgi:hypothetical protein